MGLELKTSGSPVRVGKMDATAYSGELAQNMSPVELDCYSTRLQSMLTANTWAANITCNCDVEKNKKDYNHVSRAAGMASEFGVRGYPTIKL